MSKLFVYKLFIGIQSFILSMLGFVYYQQTNDLERIDTLLKKGRSIAKEYAEKSLLESIKAEEFNAKALISQQEAEKTLELIEFCNSGL